MIKDRELRGKVVEVSERMYLRGLVAGAGGNVSVLDRESKEVYITPSGLSKGYLKPDDILKIDLAGKVIEGKLKPTSETSLHLSIYHSRKDVNAVVHAHPPICTGFACAGVPLDFSIYPEVIIMIGEIPLVEYATPTTEDLPIAITKYVKNHDGFLLRSHGTITLGTNLEQAYQRLELLEDFARIVLVAKLLGGPKKLSNEEVERIRSLQSEKYRLKLAEEMK